MTNAASYARVLDEKGLRHSGVEARGEDMEVVSFGMKTDSTNVRVTAFFEKDSPVVGIRCFGLVQVPENKFGDVLLVCNELNCEYKFAKFTIDKDNEVTLAEDAIVDQNSAGSEAFTLAVQAVNIAEKAYPRFMRAVWG